MKRREIREHLFLMLFCNDFYEAEELNEQADSYLDCVELRKEEGIFAEVQKPLSEDDKIYLKNRFRDVVAHLEEIDSLIEESSTGWKINRIGKEELTIMRVAIYEMKFDEEVPTKVAINEAVELAKKYGEDSARSFVNGILAKVAK